ncbi:MAG: GuaB3 family IMP dehydrogenase-related protein [Actinomycetota bacterium]|nr:GuaB3 family IMP dehydrogenase-related protein [Actinomycetota bacterium]
MAAVEIGAGKSARRGYGLDELAIVPSRRTRDADVVDLSWLLDAYRFDLPVLAGPSDAVVSPATAAAISDLGGLAVLDLEGLWTRYEDPEPLIEELAGSPADELGGRLRALYAEPVRAELVVERIRALSATGAVTAGALSPARAAELAPAVLEADLDVLVVQGTVVSAEHVTRGEAPLDLRQFIRQLDLPVLVGGCASSHAALHLMRTGAVGVLVGTGLGRSGAADDVLGIGVPDATAIADAAGARTRHLEETGVYVQVIAAGGLATSADVAKALACGADAVMLGPALASAEEAPGRGRFWDGAAAHPTLPRVAPPLAPPPAAGASLKELFVGPARAADGRTNLFGALRTTLAACGYASVREFHKAELVVSAAAGGDPARVASA